MNLQAKNKKTIDNSSSERISVQVLSSRSKCLLGGHMSFSSSFRSLSAVASVLLFSAVLATAQTSTSNIRGTVTDPQGSVVPGATVTLTNLANNAARQQTTNAGGSYSFELLPPGDYRLE